MSHNDKKRPPFPARAVVTGGMPYGEKTLHFGHVGGCFIHADIYARFLRCRLGNDNVIFVSGTDCYGAGPEVKFQALKQDGNEGTLEDFLANNHEAQKKDLADFNISLNLYAASAFGEAKEIHKQESQEIFNALYEKGYLKLNETLQFYDEENQVILNGRQVEGRCPIAGCKSEKAYADECGLGHQFNPSDLIAPKIVNTGKLPVLKAIKNWYFDLERFSEALKKRQDYLREEGASRKVLLSVIDDYLKDPAILIKTEDFNTLRNACDQMPSHTAEINEENKSAVLHFKVLKDREKACELLRAHGIRFRTGTTLTPFRLSGNVAWGIPVPAADGVDGQTFWVWPESLWAPISFVRTYLKQITANPKEPAESVSQSKTSEGFYDNWKDWWFSPDSKVYQFIGEDNIFFYAVAEMGLFMALGHEHLPTIVPNKHLFYGNKKAASSGAVKPPTPAELLAHYTVEQLRMHFGHMALQHDSVKFIPKAIMENQTGFDATLAEGNILTNVYNRLVRSCFYTMQKHFGGKLPDGEAASSNEIIHDYEWAMYRFEFSKVIDLLDEYLRNANKDWAAKSKEAGNAQILLDTFHVVRVAATLLHPFAPDGTETVREYLNIDERLWSWDYIDKPLTWFVGENHEFKFLEPKVDFFTKHPSQLGQ